MKDFYKNKMIENYKNKLTNNSTNKQEEEQNKTKIKRPKRPKHEEQNNTPNSNLGCNKVRYNYSISINNTFCVIRFIFV